MGWVPPKPPSTSAQTEPNPQVLSDSLHNLKSSMTVHSRYPLPIPLKVYDPVVVRRQEWYVHEEYRTFELKFVHRLVRNDNHPRPPTGGISGLEEMYPCPITKILSNDFRGKQSSSLTSSTATSVKIRLSPSRSAWIP